MVILVLGVPVGAAKTTDLLNKQSQVAADKLPIAYNMAIKLLSNTNYTGKLNATNTKTYNIIKKPVNGTLELNKTSGKFIYTPYEKFTGNDSFTYNVNNGTINSNTATVKITVITNTPTNGSNTIYVAKNGTDRNTGLTPTTPKRNIKNAIDSSKQGDTISIAPGTYIYAPIIITKDLTLTGNNQNNTFIDGQGINKCIIIQSGTKVAISNLTIENGKDIKFNNSSGGGIFNAGVLTLTNSTITDSISKYGGGIFNSGTITMVEVIIRNNNAETYGGGVANKNTLTMKNSIITKNTASTQHGGGIYNSGVLTIEDSTITKNNAGNPGGIYGNSGGGIYNCNLLCIYGSTITYNTAKAGGGLKNDGKAYVDPITMITRNNPNNVQGKPLIPA